MQLIRLRLDMYSDNRCSAVQLGDCSYDALVRHAHEYHARHRAIFSLQGVHKSDDRREWAWLSLLRVHLSVLELRSRYIS